MFKVYIELTINNLQKKDIPKVGEMKLIYNSSTILILGPPPPPPPQNLGHCATLIHNKILLNLGTQKTIKNPMNLSVYSKGFFSQNSQVGSLGRNLALINIKW
jgi:hypothetical protein